MRCSGIIHFMRDNYYQDGILMPSLTLSAAQRIYSKMMCLNGFPNLTLKEMSAELGYTGQTLSVARSTALGMKKVRELKPRKKKPVIRATVFVAKEACFCGECPVGKQSAECYSIEVAGRPMIDPCLDYLNSKSFC